MPRPALLFVVSVACPLFVTTWIAADEPVDYVRQVKPLLENHCFSCHGALQQRQALRLDTVASMRRGGESGPVVVSGDAAKSLLIGVLTGDAGFRMPPDGEGTRLTDEEIELLARWIRQGATGPGDERPQEDPRKHWSYQPVRRPAIPPPHADDPARDAAARDAAARDAAARDADARDAVPQAAWGENPIDAFVAAGHRQHGLRPRPPAAAEVLLRRLYLDLVGVPPTPDELRAFLQDDSPLAYEAVVDRLLADPRYGQRWGRHWMDIWRYSDWYGRRGSNEIRYSQRHIWRWRDWIVDALNEDKGYDQMLVEMLAGDEVAPTDPNVLRATGFLGRNWYKFDRNTWLFETVEQTSRGMLAMTMRCARCHDHKFDPISQVDYYRLRAFFEPHGVRVDPLSGREGAVTDNGEEQVASGGLARAYDAELATPTYRFIRGDDRRPDKDQPLDAAVPEVFANQVPGVAEVALPVEAYYPALQPNVLRGRLANADAALQAARTKLAEAKARLELWANNLSEFDARVAAGSTDDRIGQRDVDAHLHDDFAELRSDDWHVVSGRWACQNGQLRQSEVGTFLTIVTTRPHPADFRARIRYTTTDPGVLHSIGMSFDVTPADWQAIYTHVQNGKSQLHAFHHQDGRDVYPSQAIVPAKIVIDQPLTMDIAVRGSLLNIWIDGSLMMAYQLPLPRRAGKFALWCHSGTANFDEIKIAPLPVDTPLAETVSATAKTRSPFASLTREDLQQEQAAAVAVVALRQLEIGVAQAEQVSLAARIDADRARYYKNAGADELARAASLAERQLAVLQAELEVGQLTREVADPQDKKRVAAEAKLQQARAKIDQESMAYTALGTAYPTQSSGRRLALARWMTDPENPRTARVCVNHIWLRHFGEPLVATVDNFGIRGQRPTHPELLDWLSAELMASDWSMTRMHRLMVTSATYRQASTAGDATENLARDPGNRYLWRMNSRRMEAEVVRDSLLATAGQLDTTLGGPDLDEATGQASRRRSLYFRTTPDNKMPLLELFDLANPNECYRRQESIVPQQALAMTNSPLALDQSRLLARSLRAIETDEAFVAAAFRRVLTRDATASEHEACRRFLARHAQLLADSSTLVPFAAGAAGSVAPAAEPALRARENLIHVLFSHNDFVTIR